MIIDDHAITRRGLLDLLAATDDIEAVDSRSSGEEAITTTARLRPDVVVVDIRLPGMDGVAVLRKITEVAPETNMVVYSAYGDRRLLSDSIAAGAQGYVMKGSPPEDLLRAIRSVAAGDAFVDPSLSPMLLMSPKDNERSLSERERETLRLLAEGLHTEQVANRVGLSVETVKADTRRAIAKLEADGRVHAVAIALRRALID